MTPNSQPTTAAASRPQSTPTAMTIARFLSHGGSGEPGIRLRGVALFMNKETETLGISFCVGSSRAGARIAISPGLSALINGSTTKTTIGGRKYAALPTVEIASHRCRLLRAKQKTIALLEWGEETPFAQASSLLQKIREAGERTNIAARTISVDAMAIGWDRGEVADRLGCLKASEQHEVIVYEDRGENLSFLKAPKDSAAGRTNPSIDPSGQSASDRAQQRADAGRAAEEQGKTGSPDDGAKNKSRLKAIGSFLRNLLPGPSRANPSITQERAVADFFKKKAKEPAPPRVTLTRADKGHVTPPTYTEVAGAADHMRNAFLEYIAIVRATKEVNLRTCRKIMQTYQRQTEGLLRVLLEEAGAAIYDNDTSQVIAGEMSGSYMAAYSDTCGFVALDKDRTERSGTTTFKTPQGHPTVVTAKCTKIMLDDRILEMASSISGPPDRPARTGGLGGAQRSLDKRGPGLRQNYLGGGKLRRGEGGHSHHDNRSCQTAERKTQRESGRSHKYKSAHDGLNISERFQSQRDLLPSHGRRGFDEPFWGHRDGGKVGWC
ncbi:hypothetical protein HW555_011787 [Spodoptera exigua]|uniref:Uncharacterized protein n=1 Tax=Spodoptera exigua TaxID=7107 RepID=A0A835G8D7_SPOEX|nr:hypothetical protein HW555_011787 [Spodoptera exigua]